MQLPGLEAMFGAVETNTASSGGSAVDVAAATHKHVFIGYVVWLIVSSLVSVFFTWKLWSSSNRQQDAVVVASSERTAKLENQTTAARAEVAKLQIAVAGAETKRAEAERALLELQERLKPRTVTPEQRDAFVKALSGVPRGKVNISVITGDPEAFTFASQLFEILGSIGFDVGPQMGSMTLFGKPPVGITASIASQSSAPAFAEPLLDALKLLDPNTEGSLGGAPGAEDSVAILVGTKPSGP
jgi:hypothetical protein